MDTPLKRTPLFEAHVAAGARMVPFGGWEMPVQYSGIVEEHRTVRADVGLFDVSHMGEFEVSGPQALAALQSLTTNAVAALEIGQVQYSLLCLPDGGIVDDLTLYRLDRERFMLTVNAANIDKDWTWVTEQSRALRGAVWRNVSAETALIAVQGPKAEALVGRLTKSNVTSIGYYRFASGRVAGAETIISRTGYTGEDGFELYLPAGDAPRKLVGIEMADRAAARHGYPVVKDGGALGVVTSGSYGPSVDKSIALAYVETAHAAIGTELGVEIRGLARPACVVKTPFHPSRVKK